MTVIWGNFAVVAMSVLLTNAQAAPCDDNFSQSGSFFQGNTYKSFADVHGVSPSSAFDGALADISKEPSWKILSSNKSAGDIQAVNADSYAKGKSIPFNVRIDALASGAKISVSYATPAGVISPEGAIKAQFCKTIAAATTTTGQQSASNAAPVAPTPVPAPAAPKTDGQLVTTADQPSNTSRTSEYKKNGMPCLAELCLGDGLAELQKIKWDRATSIANFSNKPIYISDIQASNAGVAAEHARKLHGYYRGDVGSVVYYLDARKFDDLFLARAHKVSVSCVWDKFAVLTGTFTSKSGNPTSVQIRLMPQGSGSEKHVWIVVAISRKFPQVLSEKQANEVAMEMQRRYAGFDNYIFAKEGDATVENEYGRGISFRLKVPLALDEKMRLHPECGGSNKVNVN
jgi:hypothetical protein